MVDIANLHRVGIVESLLHAIDDRRSQFGRGLKNTQLCHHGFVAVQNEAVGEQAGNILEVTRVDARIGLAAIGRRQLSVVRTFGADPSLD